MILNDQGQYWKLATRLKYNDLKRYAGLELDMKEFITLFGNGRIFVKPHWILIAPLEGSMTMYPEKNTSAMRYSLSAVMLEQKRSAFDRMTELLSEEHLVSCE